MADEQSGGGGGGRRVLFIVLGVVAALAVLSCVVCGAGGAFCAHEIQPTPREPARVEQTLYYGTWVGDGPTTLTVDAGSVHWEHATSASGHTSYNGPFAGISGQNIRVNIVVTEVELVVSDPPHQDATGAWVMTVEGIPLHRE
jgi:hypothetical protein